MSKATLVVQHYGKNMRKLPDIYEISKHFPVGKNGVVGKEWHSTNDGEVVTIEWTFATEADRDQFRSIHPELEEYTTYA